MGPQIEAFAVSKKTWQQARFSWASGNSLVAVSRRPETFVAGLLSWLTSGERKLLCLCAFLFGNKLPDMLSRPYPIGAHKGPWEGFGNKFPSLREGVVVAVPRFWGQK